MTAKPAVVAAGAVVFRGSGEQRRVLVEHRPHYNDWTLPKGKPHGDEQLPVTAVREVEEETGIHVRLGLPLPSLRYDVSAGPKQVHFWLGHENRPEHPHRDDETDRIAWPMLPEAAELLTYPDEVELLARAVPLADRALGTLVITRHAKARPRKSWQGDDWLRPLAARGARQSDRLVALLDAFGVRRVLSSTSTRCLQTVEPFAKAIGSQIHPVHLLSEEAALGRDEEIADLMWQLRVQVAQSPEDPLVVCGHRPALGAMQAGLHIPIQHLTTAQSLVLHIGDEAEPVAVESYPSPL
ncbi:NUDIX hydrolase [Propionibacterium freudenreichii]|uniref:NUDIX hydrolase n=1 Tax=Propionibacterium freudenreichii TaxID=1744 RepID=UPI0005A5C75C|nr:NUDIX domain-containing protein [Propionibacterium freudenreichii]CEI31788.1 NUDIX hydrolase NTP pyrophosphohydrolases including oxidative damage repair enzymes [Propionibacterium freudenreichii]